MWHNPIFSCYCNVYLIVKFIYIDCLFRHYLDIVHNSDQLLCAIHQEFDLNCETFYDGMMSRSRSRVT